MTADENDDKVVVLEHRIVLLLNKLKHYHLELSACKSENQEIVQQNYNLRKIISSLREENKSLKIASNLLGSKEGKVETKSKINHLIKEVDLCISQLYKIG